MDRPDDKPRTAEERLARANRLFKEHYASCFWHMKPDLVVTEELLPVIVKGLRTYGGRQGFFDAARLVE